MLIEKPKKVLLIVVGLAGLVLVGLNRGEVVSFGTTLVQTIAATVRPTPIGERVGGIATRPLEPIGFSPDTYRSGRGPGE